MTGNVGGVGGRFHFDCLIFLTRKINVRKVTKQNQSKEIAIFVLFSLAMEKVKMVLQHGNYY